MGFSSRRKRRRDAPRNGKAEAAIERFIYEIRKLRAGARDGASRSVPDTANNQDGDKTNDRKTN